MVSYSAPANTPVLAARFKGARADRFADLLEILTSLGHARAIRVISPP